jgi:magnesium chelatase accessory protein
MMSRWSVAELTQRLPQLSTPLVQLIGARDGTVPPSAAERVRERLPSAEVVLLPGLGHLAHEEGPDRVAREIFRACHRRHI